MDDIVLRAMQKWPGVPRVYGWLALDRRGEWLIKNRSGAFSRIANAAFTAFIGRNYACDDAGCWFFQNGPQRVFVALHYTPWVYRLDLRGEGLVAHTGRPVTRLRSLLLDEEGMLLAVDDFGPGVLLDRDLAPVLERLQRENPGLSEEELLARREREIVVFGVRIPFSGVCAREVPSRFGFIAAPAPLDGAPDC